MNDSTVNKVGSPGSEGNSEAFAALPAVGNCLESAGFAKLKKLYGESLVLTVLRAAIEGLRERIRQEGLSAVQIRELGEIKQLSRQVRENIESLLSPRPRTVLNGTGVIVHTNLGRSVLSRAAAARVADVAQGTMDLEYDLEQGTRGSRGAHLAPLLDVLFPGYDSLVVNNNAAAIMLCLQALASGKEVPVSRGELVEIGGSFRVPDILRASGASLVEIGTTNRTSPVDYRDAIGPNTGLLLKVHTSNFRIVGFASEASIEELAAVAGKTGVPLVVDWGSGDLLDLEPAGIRDEMPVCEVLAKGADLVTFSGDKLLGGAQSGFIVGRPDLIEKLRCHPLARVCRLDRLQTAALHATLSSYVRGAAWEEVPTLVMIGRSATSIGARAEAVAKDIESATGDSGWCLVIDGTSKPGGGSSPTGEIETKLLQILVPGLDGGHLEGAARAGEMPVIGRVAEGAFLLDLRTIDPADDARLTELLIAALKR